MSRLELHPLPGTKRAGELVRLMSNLLGDGRRIVVFVADEGRRQILDDYLWTHDPLSFLPHALWRRDDGEIDDPVVLLGETANPNHAEVLVVGDGLPPEEWAREFDEVHDFVADDDDARREFWQRWQNAR